MWFAPHHDHHARVLRVDPGPTFGPELKRSELGDDAIELRAWFVDPDGDRLVLLATPDGPTLFHDGRALVLRPGEWTAKIAEIDAQRRLFQLEADGEVWLTVEYEAPPSDFGAYSDADTVDMFRWLVTKQDRPAFYSFWTVDWPA